MFWELGNTKRGLEFFEAPEQFNSYSYARNNPILYTDPSGETAMLMGDIVNAYAAGVTAAGLALAWGVNKAMDELYWNKKMDEAMKQDTTTKIQSGNSRGSGGGGGDGDKKGVADLSTATATITSKILKNKEVQKTLGRIKSGEGKYKKDGIIWQNKDGPLPKQKEGYYKERMVDTSGAKDRGTQRVVTGEKGEQYYTNDHYKTFIKIK